jgi:DNA-3-methyladenine glycosylase II
MTNYQTAADWLSEHDPVLASVITASPLPDITPHTDYYGALVNSIIGQQLSVKAASTIKQRFKDLFGGQLPAPELILETSHDDLRSCGLSNAKANYIRDLAEHVLDGRIKFDRIPNQSNAEIIGELTDVKGIGEWTVHMFLMFCVGRQDVLATGDLGVRNGIRNLYGLAAAPTPQKVTELAQTNSWHPYESIACWYVWRSLDNCEKVRPNPPML